MRTNLAIKILAKYVKLLALYFGVEVRYAPDDNNTLVKKQEMALVKKQEMAFALKAIEAYIGKEIDHEYYLFYEYCKNNSNVSKAQLLQDLFVQYILKDKRRGYFVEFGAANGVNLSNSYMLEKDFEWSGILAEPAKCWHEPLTANRSCHVDRRCVWSRSGEKLVFSEVSTPELSTIGSFSNRDGHAVSRQTAVQYAVETISLKDMLQFYNAPKLIDYLSIDTEGSEFEILNSFDFKEYDIQVITVEHNYVNPDRENIYNLLVGLGYKRKFEAFSQFDDWYVKGPL
jgi:FkbM family methyltransferase